MTQLQRLQAAIKRFESIQSKKSRFGATDTEPDGVFQQLLVRAFRGKEVVVPNSARGWELYSEMQGNGLAAHALARATLECIRIIKETKLEDAGSIEKYLRDYCWRIEWT